MRFKAEKSDEILKQASIHFQSSVDPDFIEYKKKTLSKPLRKN